MPLSEWGRVPYARAGFGAALMRDWVNDFEKVRPFLRRDPRKTEDWTKLLEELRAQAYPRAELSALLQKTLSEYGAAAPALENARALAQPNTFAVLTGQQAGLFGGPLYSLLKAITAIKLARELSARHGVKVVPVFWVASDDHDLGEIDHAYFSGANGALERLHLKLGAEAKGASACDVKAGEGLEELARALTALLPEAAPALLAPYQTRNLGAAFTELLTRWLSPLGLIVVESRDLRALGQKLYARELEEYVTTAAELRESAKAVRAAGYEAQFSGEDAHPHFFITSQGLRARLEPEVDGALFREKSAAFAAHKIEPASYTKADLANLIAAQPERFSADATLRPVVQQAIFPVLSVVLGPGEFAYWIQLAPLHDRLGAVWPMLMPRASVTLLDAAHAKHARRLELGPDEIFETLDVLKVRLLKGGPAEAALLRARERIGGGLEALEHEIGEQKLGLDTLFGRARERIGHELARIEEKTRAALLQRDGAKLAHVEALSRFVLPSGNPQERTLCGGQFMTTRLGLAEELAETLDPFCFEHRILIME